jgi:hypothetical protein
MAGTANFTKQSRMSTLSFLFTSPVNSFRNKTVDSRNWILLSCALLFLWLAYRVPAQTRPLTPEKDTFVRTQMNNVRYHFSETVSVQINSLVGSFVPIANNEFPIFDDKNSFKIRIESAEIAISPADLADLLNSYVFARKGAPLSGISIETIPNGKLKVKGRLHDKGNIPFETESTLSPTDDGKLRLHTEQIKAVHVPVKGLMETFRLEIGDLIKSGKVPGVLAENNDLILDLSQILPAPHIEGKVTAVRIETNSIIQTFGNKVVQASGKVSGNYMAFQNNRLRFGKLTMDDTNLTLIDMDPADPMDFFLDHYKEQLVAGYTKIAPNFQLRVFMKDYDKLKHARSSVPKSQ